MMMRPHNHVGAPKPEKELFFGEETRDDMDDYLR
jgi:hypothetical protein